MRQSRMASRIWCPSSAAPGGRERLLTRDHRAPAAQDVLGQFQHQLSLSSHHQDEGLVIEEDPAPGETP